MSDQSAISRHSAVISQELFNKNPYFSSYPVFNDFLKNHKGVLNLQWVFLKPGEEVSLHHHDVDTLMIACKGKCILTGEIESLFEEGNAILVPKLFIHGLLAYNNESFSGFSLRFES
jgi:quercetin dioxygenase-like cupin family protein